MTDDAPAIPHRPLDSQQIEILGRNLVKASLIEAGLEISTPERDNGIDLIAYRWDPDRVFIAYPIQVKTASGFSFSMDRKYEHIPGLIMVYAMNSRSLSESTIFAMTYGQMVRIGDAMGWTASPSWTAHGRYSSTRPSQKIKALLEPYRADPRRWAMLLPEG